MRIAGSTLTYSRLDLGAACRRLADMGFDTIDVGALAGSVLFGVMLLRRARRNGAEPIVIEERSRE